MAVATSDVLIRKYTVAAPTSGSASRDEARDGAAAEQVKREPGAFDRQHERGHAEERPMHRRPRPRVQVALAQRAGGGDEHRRVRADEEQRREVDGVRHRHGRAAREERELHFERGRRGGQHEQDDEQDRLVESREREAGGEQRGARDDDRR